MTTNAAVRSSLSPSGSDELVQVWKGADGVHQAISRVVSKGQPYCLFGDCETFARVLAPAAADLIQEVEQRKIRGYVLTPQDQAAPRAATERVRFYQPGTSFRSVSIIQGDDSYTISLDGAILVYFTSDPVYTAVAQSQFWTLWEASVGNVPVRPLTKHDYMRLPDTAPRSTWTIDEAVLDDIRRAQQTTFLLNLDCISRAFRRFRDLLPDNVQIMYSIKTNPDRRVLALLNHLGSGFEAASHAEVELALAAGASVEKIILSAPVKRRGDVRRSHAAGVEVYTADSAAEVQKIADEAPGAKVLIRIQTPGARSAKIDLSTKYGADPRQLLPLLRGARTAGLRPHGITFNVGGQNEVTSAWDESLEAVHELMGACNDEQFGLRTIDMGGGYPIPVHPFVPDLESVTQQMRHALLDFDYLTEPGRILVADAGKLVTPVASRVVRDGAVWLYIDASLYGSLQMMDRHGFYFPITTDQVSIDTQEYVISSLSCDGRDIISHRTVLPAGIEEGHLLTFHFLGAYSLPLFNISYGGVSKADIRYLG